ncbi:hypothetical protein DUNSADRAFT_11433 [Dunaliella salina]|uniref:Encoded protein n=1 Tax=Dunaliella salina TaxID=3046 RepID=A0ABQ7GDD1_DUNSA|nr:hypothetical protein DUNSADRAFT_11433 [Dunaliella salina]|eukprot:KAF5832616.1 hypothetical protein DUNSADRAFT_11433 [Dunaliella salina]
MLDQSQYEPYPCCRMPFQTTFFTKLGGAPNWVVYQNGSALSSRGRPAGRTQRGPHLMTHPLWCIICPGRASCCAGGSKLRGKSCRESQPSSLPHPDVSLCRAARHAARKAAAQGAGEELQGRGGADSRGPSKPYEAEHRDAAEQRLGSTSGSSRSSNTLSRSSSSGGSSGGCSSSCEGREGLEGGDKKGRERGDLRLNVEEGQRGEGGEPQQQQESSPLQGEGRGSRGFGGGSRRSRKRRTVALREDGSASSVSPERCASSPSFGKGCQDPDSLSRMSSRSSSPRKSSRRQSMHSQKSRKIERRQSCLNRRVSSGRNQLVTPFAHMNQVTRRLGLARSRAQATPTPAVIKRPEDLTAAAAPLPSADQGTRPVDAEDAAATNGAEVTASRLAAESETLRELAQQALQDGLFVQDPQTSVHPLLACLFMFRNIVGQCSPASLGQQELACLCSAAQQDMALLKLTA